MGAAQAIADLTDISSQIETVVLLGPDGKVAGSNATDDAVAKRFAESAQALLKAAEEAHAGSDSLTQLEAETAEGSVFVLRDGERLIAATAGPDPTVGLVFYDLKSCLRDAAAEPETAVKKPARKPRAKAAPKKKKTEENGA